MSLPAKRKANLMLKYESIERITASAEKDGEHPPNLQRTVS